MSRPPSPSPSQLPTRVFLLSPAHCGGKRAAVLMNGAATFDLARRVRGDAGAPPATLAETFSFLSGLYFRGKLAYVRAFARGAGGPGVQPGADVIDDCRGGAWVITSDRGLVSPDAPVTTDDLRRMAAVTVDVGEPRYREPLARDATRIADAIGPAGEAVLLGSVATGKYVDILAAVLGDRLKCPAEFVGLGDMSRGAVMLRAAAAGRELAYITIPRPPTRRSSNRPAPRAAAGRGRSAPTEPPAAPPGPAFRPRRRVI